MKLLVSVHQTQVCDLISSILFIDNVLGIYLMFNGDCYPNSSYINEMYVIQTSKLQCVLPNSTLSGGQWIGPKGNSVNCNNNNNNVLLKCDTTDNPTNISLYRGGKAFYEANKYDNNNTFKCCLPSNCSDPTTNIITVNIFSKLYCTSIHCYSLLIYFRTYSNLKLQCC